MKHRNLKFSDINSEFKNYWKNEGRRHHGGEYSRGKRKTRRPLSVRKPVHLVLKSDKVRGAMSMRSPKNWVQIKKLIQKYSRKFNIRIYQYSINSNHIHIILKTKTRRSFQDFLRSLTGMIARFILMAQKGMARGKFWASLAFTRISDWGRDFKSLKKYVIQNILEASGVIAYKPRQAKANERSLRNFFLVCKGRLKK